MDQAFVIFILIFLCNSSLHKSEGKPETSHLSPGNLQIHYNSIKWILISYQNMSMFPYKMVQVYYAKHCRRMKGLVCFEGSKFLKYFKKYVIMHLTMYLRGKWNKRVRTALYKHTEIHIWFNWEVKMCI